MGPPTSTFSSTKEPHARHEAHSRAHSADGLLPESPQGQGAGPARSENPSDRKLGSNQGLHRLARSLRQCHPFPLKPPEVNPAPDPQPRQQPNHNDIPKHCTPAAESPESCPHWHRSQRPPVPITPLQPPQARVPLSPVESSHAGPQLPDLAPPQHPLAEVPRLCESQAAGA